MAVYKVSFVVAGSEHPGAIVNRDHLPEIGEKISLGADVFEVIEVMELMPPRGQFYYIHATLQLSKKRAPSKKREQTSA